MSAGCYLFVLKVAKQKYNSYNYVNYVFTPNSFGTSLESGQPEDPCYLTRYLLLADQIHILILIS